ncbi:MAG: 3-phosphoshikimate 1-carboxyvinyltransferase [Gammaproteobacteria bacterium]
MVEHRPRLRGNVFIPGDKSISHRALILAAISDYKTTIHHFLRSTDTMATLHACRQLGVPITLEKELIIVEGVGLDGLRAPTQPLDLGNSGTGFRLLAGLLAGQKFNSMLTGDSSLKSRPMERIFGPLRLMGATIDASQFPVHIYGQPLKGIQYSLPIPSAQVKSCLLLASLYATGKTVITETVPTRDHTERLLAFFPSPYSTLSPSGGRELIDCCIPGDISSAAFFMVGASILPGSDILLKSIGVNPTRLGIVHILRLMGADITLKNDQMMGQEPVADIRVRYAPLRGIEIPQEYIVSAIDEFPIIFIAAACAQGTTRLTGAAELRVKESDRIASMVLGLQTLGIKATALPEGVVIEGGKFTGGTVDSYGDHRVAMAFAIAGLVAQAEVNVLNRTNISTSFPDFDTVAKQLGMKINES